MKDGFGSFLRLYRFYSAMKIKIISAISVALVLSACGPGNAVKNSSETKNTPEVTLPAGPDSDSIGVLAAVNGQMITLDHEGASTVKLTAGRTVFQAYGDVLAEAPLTPGARVAFKFHKIGDAWELTQLTAR